MGSGWRPISTRTLCQQRPDVGSRSVDQDAMRAHDVAVLLLFWCRSAAVDDQRLGIGRLSQLTMLTIMPSSFDSMLKFCRSCRPTFYRRGCRPRPARENLEQAEWVVRPDIRSSSAYLRAVEMEAAQASLVEQGGTIVGNVRPCA